MPARYVIKCNHCGVEVSSLTALGKHYKQVHTSVYEKGLEMYRMTKSALNGEALANAMNFYGE